MQGLKMSEEDKRAQMAIIPKEAHADKDFGLSVKPFSTPYSVPKPETPLPREVDIKRVRPQMAKSSSRVIVDTIETTTDIRGPPASKTSQMSRAGSVRMGLESQESFPPELQAEQASLRRDLDDRRARLNEELAAKRREAEEMSATRAAELDGERIRLAEIESQRQGQFEKQLAELKAEIQAQQPELDAARERLAKSQAELDEARRQLEEERQKREAELQRLRDEEARLMEELKRAEDELEQKRAERCFGSQIDQMRNYICVHDHNPGSCPICRVYAHDDIPILPY